MKRVVLLRKRHIYLGESEVQYYQKIKCVKKPGIQARRKSFGKGRRTMKDLKGTETLKNLMIAFAGESEARNKYTYYASKAKKEGYVQISKIFEETAGNEKEHAELWFKWAHGIGTTEENLVDAASGEHYEWTDMYEKMAKTAREEGFDEIARQMEGVLSIEREHEKRYLKLAENLKNGKVFEKDEPVTWQCSNCGYQFTGKEAPEICPVCAHEKAYFQIKAENY